VIADVAEEVEVEVEVEVVESSRSVKPESERGPGERVPSKERAITRRLPDSRSPKLQRKKLDVEAMRREVGVGGESGEVRVRWRWSVRSSKPVEEVGVVVAGTG
jgi:hypothetical protein